MPDVDTGDGDVLTTCVLLLLHYSDRDRHEIDDLVYALGLSRHRPSLPTVLSELRRQALISSDFHSPYLGQRPPRYWLTEEGCRWLVERDQAIAAVDRLIARFLDCYFVSS